MQCHSVDKELHLGSRCQILCTRIHLPICASNGATYDNECMLNKAICIHDNMNDAKRETLFKISDGPCPSIPQTRGRKI